MSLQEIICFHHNTALLSHTNSNVNVNIFKLLYKMFETTKIVKNKVPFGNRSYLDRNC